MILHSLQLHAFGTFAGTVQIDFDAVGANGIFLLEGPTGVGKSTVIDAVVFALYGEMAGSVASRNRARSDFAAPDDPTFVDLVLETGNGIFRIRRTPQYERAKQRGTGTTTQQATVRMWRLEPGALDAWALAPRTASGRPGEARDHGDLDGAGELLATRLDEAGVQVRHVVGLTREQLAQTIVLPQGEFASFLRAKPEERTQLLQQVFQTGIYLDAQKALADRRRALGALVEDTRRAAVGSVERLAALAPDAPPPVEQDAPPAEQERQADPSPVEQGRRARVETPVPLPWLTADASLDPPSSGHDAEEGADVLKVAETCREGSDSAAQQAEQIAERARQARDEAAAALRETRALLRLVERRDDARARRTELQERAEQVEVERRTVAAAQRAAAVAPVLARAETAHEARTAAGQAWDDAAGTAKALGMVAPGGVATGSVTTADDGGEPGKEPTTPFGAWLGQRQDELLADSVLLDALERQVGSLTEGADRLQEVLDELAAVRAAARADEDELAAVPQAVAVVQEERARMEATARGLDLATARLAAAEEQRDDLGRVGEALADWRVAADALLAAKARADDATHAEAHLRLRRREGIAGELASGLAEDEPCPVCGSRAHPRPAELSDTHVSQEEVDAAERDRRVADEEFQTANGRHEAARARLDHLAERAGLDGAVLRAADTDDLLAPAVAAAREAVVTAAQERDVAARAGEALPEVLARLEALGAREAELRERASAAASARAGRVARLESGCAAIQDDRAGLTDQLREVAARVGVELALPAGAEGAEPAVAIEPAVSGEPVASVEPVESPGPTELPGIAAPSSTVARPATAEPEPFAARVIAQTRAFEKSLRPALSRVRDAVRERRDALAAWARADGTRSQAEEDARVRAEERDEALAVHGFTTADEAAAAAMPVPELAALERSVDGHDSALRAVAAELAVADVAALPDEASVESVVTDVTRAQEALARAEQEEDEAREAATRARSLALTVAQHVAEVHRDVTAYRDAVRDSAVVLRVSDLVTARSADNAPALTLSTYVLVQRFEAVVEAANRRLAVMSDGRYELVRSDERERKGGRNLGLALRVIDHVTGAVRETTTLSGGETFYVSLCLALGLADVVSAEAGGIEFGTLFVDEGFGTLDASTLEVVMTEITRLRDAGRVVGLVSHVEALKQMIPERIQVRRRPDGASEVRVVA